MTTQPIILKSTTQPLNLEAGGLYYQQIFNKGKDGIEIKIYKYNDNGENPKLVGTFSG